MSRATRIRKMDDAMRVPKAFHCKKAKRRHWHPAAWKGPKKKWDCELLQVRQLDRIIYCDWWERQKRNQPAMNMYRSSITVGELRAEFQRIREARREELRRLLLITTDQAV